MLGHCPPDDTATVHVEHHCEIEKAHPLREVRHPQLVGGSGSNIACYAVRSGRGICATPGSTRFFAVVAPLQSGEAYYTRDPLARAIPPLVAQLGPDARRAISAPTARMDPANLCAKGGVGATAR